MITSTTKSTKSINIELYQLHKLASTFSAIPGSLSRMADINGVGEINFFDIAILERYLEGSYNYFTSDQKKNADVTQDGVISTSDIAALNSIVSGDINQDGENDVSDIVLLVSYILSGFSDIDPSHDINMADWNYDGNIDIQDIVLMVESIISGN